MGDEVLRGAASTARTAGGDFEAMESILSNLLRGLF
jgi:hypothetical protein